MHFAILCIHPDCLLSSLPLQRFFLSVTKNCSYNDMKDFILNNVGK